MLNQINLIVDRFGAKFEDDIQSNFKLQFKNYVIYFEKEEDLELNSYIRENYNRLQVSFAKAYKKFIYIPLITEEHLNLDEVIEYYYPQFSFYNLSNKINDKYIDQLSKPLNIKYNDLLELIGYDGSINSGFIFLDYESYAFGVSTHFTKNKVNNDYQPFFDDLIAYFYFIEDGYCFCISNPIKDYSEQLDDETIKIINEIESKLSNLQQSGQLILLAPILKQILNEQVKKINLDDISRIEINLQNRIWLPFFKKEVEMSHLTKSIYFLFLKHPEGINLKDLENHKRELLNIYTSISNQLDYDKMKKSVYDVCCIETKAIYSHISRIKSAYYKLMDASYAKHYIISGYGEENRKVLFNNKAIDWDELNFIDNYDL